MPRGRPPKPVERLVATQRDATHKADGREIAIREVTPVRSVPPLPSTVSGRGAVEWEKVWTAGYWLHRDQDYHWVEMIAQAYSDAARFRAQVEAEGLVSTGYAGQVVAHPLIAEIRKCEATIQKCLSILGFSPTDRARLAITEAKAQDALEQMLRNREEAPKVSYTADIIEG